MSCTRCFLRLGWVLTLRATPSWLCVASHDCSAAPQLLPPTWHAVVSRCCPHGVHNAIHGVVLRQRRQLSGRCAQPAQQVAVHAGHQGGQAAKGGGDGVELNLRACGVGTASASTPVGQGANLCSNQASRQAVRSCAAQQPQPPITACIAPASPSAHLQQRVGGRMQHVVGAQHRQHTLLPCRLPRVPHISCLTEHPQQPRLRTDEQGEWGSERTAGFVAKSSKHIMLAAFQMPSLSSCSCRLVAHWRTQQQQCIAAGRPPP